ncbi:cytochrome oxidase putative small subunit CydP [Thiobacillus sp.]
MKSPMPTFLHHPLAREISLAIVIKLLVIAAIFYAFFDGHALHLDADSVAHRLANSEQAPASQPSSGSPHAD